MKSSAVILAAGKGSKMYPFSSVRSKTTIKIAGIPLILYNTRALLDLGFEDITVVTLSLYEREINAVFADIPAVRVVAAGDNGGSADSLLCAAAELKDSSDDCLVLYGDTLIDSGDMAALLRAGGPAVLLSPLIEPATNWIGAALSGGKVSHIGAHERGGRVTHAFAAFLLSMQCIQSLRDTPDYFPGVKAGVGVPRERYIEAGLLPLVKRGMLNALECARPFIDIDKPWHMLAANRLMVEARCAALRENSLGEGAYISPDARIEGFVQLGKDSRIGQGVVIKGGLIAGDNTVIENGAVFEGGAVIGDNTSIRHYCKIGAGVSIGSSCVIDHCAEIIGGLLMDKVYLCHYGEFFGAAGSYTDLGAGTVCGTLRFDDGESPQVVRGRREIPPFYANACYLGDYCRTGVGAMLMPGCMAGPYSIVGPGVLLEKDLPERKMIRLKQEHEITEWGENRYGW